MRILLPPAALVLLVGPAGSGKSTFARAHFGPTQVVSSDFCRALVADDEDDQSASPAAFEVLYLVVRHRLRRRRLTVVDATSVDPVQRRQLLRLARAPGTPVVAVVFDLPEELCVERDAGRPGRSVGPAVIHLQRERMLRWLPAMDLEGFTAVYRLGSAAELDCATVAVPPLRPFGAPPPGGRR